MSFDCARPFRSKLFPPTNGVPCLSREGNGMGMVGCGPCPKTRGKFPSLALAVSVHIFIIPPHQRTTIVFINGYRCTMCGAQCVPPHKIAEGVADFHKISMHLCVQRKRIKMWSPKIKLFFFFFPKAIRFHGAFLPLLSVPLFFVGCSLNCLVDDFSLCVAQRVSRFGEVKALFIPHGQH